MTRSITAPLLAAAALALPAVAGAASISLFGDKDCFGSGGACTEGVNLANWGVVSTGVADPSPTDRRISTGLSVSWTQTFAPGSYADALVTLRTAGIADIAGPYTLFADSVALGVMPLDGFGHRLVETFSFAIDGALLADGTVNFSFAPVDGDLFAIDYVEITGRSVAAVPVPGTLALAGLALAGLLGWRRRG
jgi:hypothetical protein